MFPWKSVTEPTKWSGDGLSVTVAVLVDTTVTAGVTDLAAYMNPPVFVIGTPPMTRGWRPRLVVVVTGATAAVPLDPNVNDKIWLMSILCVVSTNSNVDVFPWKSVTEPTKRSGDGLSVTIAV